MAEDHSAKRRAAGGLIQQAEHRIARRPEHRGRWHDRRGHLRRDATEVVFRAGLGARGEREDVLVALAGGRPRCRRAPARIAGHRDGGYLVCSTYSMLAEQRALARTASPSTPTSNANKASNTSSQSRRSRRSGSAKESRRRCNRTAIRSYHPMHTSSIIKRPKARKMRPFLVPPGELNRYPHRQNFQQKTPAKRGSLGQARKNENRGD